jgi:hypothetical protein
MAITVLVVLIAAIIVFYIAGGSVDIDADVRSPRVDVDWGRLPDFNVDRGPDAEAGDPE